MGKFIAAKHLSVVNRSYVAIVYRANMENTHAKAVVINAIGVGRNDSSRMFACSSRRNMDVLSMQYWYLAMGKVSMSVVIAVCVRATNKSNLRM